MMLERASFSSALMAKAWMSSITVGPDFFVQTWGKGSQSHCWSRAGTLLSCYRAMSSSMFEPTPAEVNHTLYQCQKWIGDIIQIPRSIWPPWSWFDVIYYRFDPEFVILGDSGRKQLMCGDVINLIGLFRLHAGKQRNIPFVHTGHLAVLSDSSERIPVRDRTTNKVVPAEVHLVEAQTLDGLSGSPVFAHEMVSLGNFVIGREPDQHPYAFGKVRLLGIYSGSWDGEPGEILASDKNLRGNVRVPVGVGTVVPADKLMELVRDHPQMKEDRKTLMQAILAERSASR
jgi:hypothetical protein